MYKLRITRFFALYNGSVMWKTPDFNFEITTNNFQHKNNTLYSIYFYMFSIKFKPMEQFYHSSLLLSENNTKCILVNIQEILAGIISTGTVTQKKLDKYH